MTSVTHTTPERAAISKDEQIARGKVNDALKRLRRERDAALAPLMATLTAAQLDENKERRRLDEAIERRQGARDAYHAAEAGFTDRENELIGESLVLGIF